MNDRPTPGDDDLGVPEGDWLDLAERRAIECAVPLAPELGWNQRLVDAALREAGIGRREARLVLPHGARDLVALLARRHDREALKALGGIDASTLKVRERIRVAVEARVDAALADEAAVRRANGFLASPLNAALALGLAWESADHLWRWAGDTATDENHYSKRAILAGVLVSTLAARLSGGPEHARGHLGRRIEQVMGFETWKARLPKPSAAGLDIAAWLGKARYGVRERFAEHHRDQTDGATALLPPPGPGIS